LLFGWIEFEGCLGGVDFEFVFCGGFEGSIVLGVWRAEIKGRAFSGDRRFDGRVLGDVGTDVAVEDRGAEGDRFEGGDLESLASHESLS
jgi:hypothetical protein